MPSTPFIQSVSPNSGIAGTSVNILGNTLLDVFDVQFNGVSALILSQSDRTMVVEAPASTTGPVQAFNSSGGSNIKIFTYSAAAVPSLISLVPASGPSGTLVTINGTNFGPSQGASTVKFNGITAGVTSWSTTVITATVPSTAGTGNVVVTVGGVASNGLLFTVTTPSNGGTSTPLNLLLIPAQAFLTAVMWTLDPTNFDDPGLGGFYNWKMEDVIAGRTPTVSRIIVSYRNLGVASFTLTLTGTNDKGDTVTNSTPVTIGTVAATGRIASKVIGLALTGQNLQASISRVPGSGSLSITKLRLEGRVETTVLA